MEKGNWKVWDNDNSYGDTLYKRAIGELPEMESSKKMAKELKKYIKSQDRVLDVGCGAGHYLRTLRREIGEDFYYSGIDRTPKYVDLAQKAFINDNKSDFKVSDIYQIDQVDSSYDIVMCNNVLLHLPSVEKPLEELVRVAKRTVLVRFLCGERSFRIKDIDPDKEVYDQNGEPQDFYYFNIYSKQFIKKILEKEKKVKNWRIEEDRDFDKQKIMGSVPDHKGAFNATRVLGDYQVNGYILLPWSILSIELA